jgi:hypothetical protein
MVAEMAPEADSFSRVDVDLVISAESGCSDAGKCNCSCIQCAFPTRFMHCFNHGNGCHASCTSE